MITKLSTALFGAALLAGAPVAAQGTGEIFHTDGFVEFTVLTNGDESSQTLTGNFTLGATFGGGLGIALGVEASRINDMTAHRLYPVVSYTSDLGTFSIGTPRFVFDTLVDVPQPAGITALRFNELGVGVRSFPGIFASLYEDEPVFGVRYDGSFDNLTVAAAYHQMELLFDDVDILSVGVSYDIGPFSLVAGVESLRDSHGTQSGYQLGVIYDDGAWNAGLVYLDNALIEQDAEAGALWASYEVTEALTVTGSLRRLNGQDIASHEVFGIDAEYTFGSGAYASIGLGSADFEGLSETGMALSLGFRF